MPSTTEIHRAWRSRTAFACMALIATVLLSPTLIFAQTTSFTYQGRFTDGGTAANGVYDMQFRLFDSGGVGTGNQLSATVTNGAVAVINGVFTVQLNFGGAAFSGADRFLELGVRPAGTSDPYTIMSPRQPLTAAVYAIRASTATNADSAASATNATNATNANNASQLGGVAASQYVLTTDPRLTVSGNFIQNTTSQQAASNFNISGDGTAAGTLSGNAINSATHYNIAGNRIFAISGAGSYNNSNTVAGVGAGTLITPDNASGAGNLNTFFGWLAGNANTNGDTNTFFGAKAGLLTVAGYSNSFFGESAGGSNTGGYQNNFFGIEAGFNNTTGHSNTFIGPLAGHSNTTGDDNVFIGDGAGGGVSTGSNNTIIGSHANVVFGAAFTNATAIGANALVSQSNSLVLGDSVNVGIGTTAPQAKLHISDSGVVRALINSNLNAGVSLALANQSKWSLAATGTGDLQIFNEALSQNAIFVNTTNNNVGIGTTTPNDKLEINGPVRLDVLGSAGSVQLCRNSNDQISTCSSSLRYKKDLHPFTRGLALLNQLKPITFRWKSDNSPDVGFGAEDIAAVEPLLVTRSDKGEVEGVKYDRLSAVLVNAVKEQQREIAQQQEEIKRQQDQIESLKRVVCQRNRHAAICR